jgi:GNAT superfamily N-acetyltransferase
VRDTTVRIRPATTDDTAYLREIQWLAILASPQLLADLGPDRLRHLEEQIWATWPAAGDTALIAEDGAGHHLGAIILRVQEREGDRVVGFRLVLAVDEAARGQGVGKELLAHAKQYAAGCGADYLTLLVDAANAPARQLYAGSGFGVSDPHGLIPMTVRFAR